MSDIQSSGARVLLGESQSGTPGILIFSTSFEKIPGHKEEKMADSQEDKISRLPVLRQIACRLFMLLLGIILGVLAVYIALDIFCSENIVRNTPLPDADLKTLALIVCFSYSIWSFAVYISFSYQAEVDYGYGMRGGN